MAAMTTAGKMLTAVRARDAATAPRRGSGCVKRWIHAWFGERRAFFLPILPVRWRAAGMCTRYMYMKVLRVSEARAGLPSLIRKVASGHPPIAIGRRGKAEAWLV